MAAVARLMPKQAARYWNSDDRPSVDWNQAVSHRIVFGGISAMTQIGARQLAGLELTSYTRAQHPSFYRKLGALVICCRKMRVDPVQLALNLFQPPLCRFCWDWRALKRSGGKKLLWDSSAMNCDETSGDKFKRTWKRYCITPSIQEWYAVNFPKSVVTQSFQLSVISYQYSLFL